MADLIPGFPVRWLGRSYRTQRGLLDAVSRRFPDYVGASVAVNEQTGTVALSVDIDCGNGYVHRADYVTGYDSRRPRSLILTR